MPLAAKTKMSAPIDLSKPLSTRVLISSKLLAEKNRNAVAKVNIIDVLLFLT